ncbi:DNA-directed RNA polymerase subunit alpha C-terminal domain-containing protein [Butyrivibrio sp. AC2005]|uniref:DNA-directed RNA polymerase subunit alpha C-terminal domain-containing protein n=1 Tax=Butyrivibrio sp. AC2005 TaxID=1280672 RepID=UPI0003FCC179|nr:DNA-directed RNA polymerase subunit alpha C-terminal domain-containing protein [Butyrivibrio sp. AC2005]
MSQDQGRTMTEIIEAVAGYRVHEKRGGKFYYNLHMNQSMSDTPIEALDLSVRSYHSLQRAGYSRIGDLAEAIAGGVELSKIRNCGSKSCREIMEKLFVYQYNMLPQEKREGYIKETMMLNAKKRRDDLVVYGSGVR